MTKQGASVLSQARLPVTQPEIPRINRSATRSWTRFLPAIAGIGYGVAWVTGLVVWPSNLAIDATEDGIVSLYATHMSQATAQYLLVEGLAGICLGTVLLYCVRRAGRGDRRWTPAAAVLGGVAVTISLSQCLLGMFLVSSTSKGLLSQSGELYTVINRLDGAKQILLGATAVSLAILRRGVPTFPHWLRRITVLLGIALVPSGLAYLFLWNALAGSTFISLPLLVLWLAGTGLWLTRPEATTALLGPRP